MSAGAAPLTIGDLRLFREGSGRIRGTSVYMLLCQDDGPIYVKVGISVDPLVRLVALRDGCPVTPQCFAMLELATKDKARSLERGLHLVFKQWHARGEWFRLEVSERLAFVAAWRTVFRRHELPSCPLTWTEVSVKEFFARRKLRGDLWKRGYAIRGKPYRDYLRHKNLA